MKASKQCPKCDSLRIGYFEKVYDRVHGQGEAPAVSSHMPQSAGVVEKRGWLITKLVGTGEMEAYLCADCGYFEQYVKDPENVPYDKLEGFHWLNPESSEAGPYR